MGRKPVAVAIGLLEELVPTGAAVVVATGKGAKGLLSMMLSVWFSFRLIVLGVLRVWMMYDDSIETIRFDNNK